jgi:hypothetical protein
MRRTRLKQGYLSVSISTFDTMTWLIACRKIGQSHGPRAVSSDHIIGLSSLLALPVLAGKLKEHCAVSAEVRTLAREQVYIYAI